MSHSFTHISVIGAGAWGTALGSAATRTGARVTLWARQEAIVESINGWNENEIYLPKHPLPAALYATSTLEDITASELLLLVTPAQYTRSMLKELAALELPKGTPLVLCSKGIENTTHKLISEIAEEFLPDHPLAILTGPSFAGEVVRGVPTALTLACSDKRLADSIIASLSSPYFRLVYTDDIIGAQIGGAVKNVLAIACGIVAGREMGDNTTAALMTLGLQEMGALSVAKGGKKETMLELCGIGDLVLTCSCMQSRNMSLGYHIGQGQSLASLLSNRTSVAEGVATAISVNGLALSLGISMPLCSAVYAILHEGAPVEILEQAIMA